MQPWRRSGICGRRRFADKVICPGFIDPHLHPVSAAVLLPIRFITAAWKALGRYRPVTPGTGSICVQALHASETNEPLFIWGYLLWHGSMEKHAFNK